MNERQASRKRLLLMLVFGGGILAFGGCAPVLPAKPKSVRNIAMCRRMFIHALLSGTNRSETWVW